MFGDISDRTEFLKTLRKNIKESYDAIESPIFCKCLQADIYFNAQGFHHLENDGSGRVRPIKERIYKLTLFPLAIPTIKNANEVFENKIIHSKISRKKNSPVKDIEYWSLIANVGKSSNVKIKVILRKVGNGQIIFWSIMKMKTKNTRS